ncbi:Mrr restriction system protein [Thiocapsa sp.]|uniref:restriction endonuclease n=1 Tax=Thiocapsa sp. TaxID=2024551 RepID=UPI002BA9021F|nr:Mrr restriction system protein [Thiocapsa sp.]HSO81827.1 Mrr restriction system protein [Thiocapsa sp.]
MAKRNGPEFLRFCIPIVEVLRELGGSGRPAEVTDLVIDRMRIPEAEQEVTNKNGGSRIRNQIAWARFYMVKAGLISSSQRGIWDVTEKGRTSDLDREFVLTLFRGAQREFISERKSVQDVEPSPADVQINPDSVDEHLDYKTLLLATLQALPPEGFERICQRLLRESGFQQVAVTGRSGDGGIDGHGILQINPLVSFKVLFQCKRYRGAVPVSAIRDFRGALQGRADKGIVLTTGTFTTDAKREAIRDGATPIELVDGDKLVEMFEALGTHRRPTPRVSGRMSETLQNAVDSSSQGRGRAFPSRCFSLPPPVVLCFEILTIA